MSVSSRAAVVARWAATAVGRSPQRAAATAACAQCGRDGTTSVVRLGRRRARYWCRRCGAVVATDRSVVRVGPPPAVEPAAQPLPPVADDGLDEVMPRAMAEWARRTSSRPPTRDGLHKGPMYQLYARWDRTAGTGLPPFSAVVGALHERCYSVDAAVAALGDGRPEVRERAQHARRWLATVARDQCWIVSRLVGGAPVDPPPGAVAPLVGEVAPGRAWSREETWAVRAALFGTDGGPHLPTVIATFGADAVRDALEAWLAGGSRPLRDAVLALLDAPPP